jgi:protein SDA1
LDIEKSNKKKKNNQLNRTLQNFMYTMLKDTSQQANRESLGVMIELWRKRVWYIFLI